MKKTLRNYLLNIPPPEGDLTQLQLDAIEKAVRQYLVEQFSEGFSSEKSSSLLVAEKETSLRKQIWLLKEDIDSRFATTKQQEKEDPNAIKDFWFRQLQYALVQLGQRVDMLNKVFSAGFLRGKSAELFGEEK